MMGKTGVKRGSEGLKSGGMKKRKDYFGKENMRIDWTELGEDERKEEGPDG